ncbi:MAG: shikimate dehydrogenase [Candidatus Methanofastidiosia archaeon]
MNLLVVAGDPIYHSLSPVMHNAAIKAVGLENEYHYEKVRLNLLEISALEKMMRIGKVHGANVTYPLKSRIVKHLDKISDEAASIGAVNTVYVRDGMLIGENTDGIGCLDALTEKCKKLDDKNVVVIGAGGAARAVAVSLVSHTTADIMIINRGIENARKLSNILKDIRGGSIGYGDMSFFKKQMDGVDIIINCTTVGMRSMGDATLPITNNKLHKDMVVMDLVYDPQVTPLLAEARKAGCGTIGGIDMLVFQGAHSFKIWTGIRAPIDIMRRAAIKAYKG